jgi:tripartite-type tricarboxylate transporter receptor subunit TctC
METLMRNIYLPIHQYLLTLLSLSSFILLSIFPTNTQAQEYPNRVVKIIVPFAPGGPSDIIARLLSQKLSENLGKSFIVENKPGGSANIGIAQVAKSPADGYTLLLVSSSFVTNPSLFKNPGFDVFKDFSPIGVPVSSPNILVAHPSFPAKNLKEFIQLMKSNPGKYDYASPGNGTGGHLSAELLAQKANLDFKHIPYNGGGPAIQAVLANQVPFGFSALPPATSQINSGKLIPLALTSKSRVSTIPNVPTIEESGFPDFEADTQQFVIAPSGTPKAIIDTLNIEITKIVTATEMRERLNSMGYLILTPNPEQTSQIIKNEVDKWAKVIKSAKIQAD